MTDAIVRKTEDIGGFTYLIGCPCCGHTWWRTEAYVQAQKAQRCPGCHELLRIWREDNNEDNS